MHDKHRLDISDWLQRRHTSSELEKIIHEAPLSDVEEGVVVTIKRQCFATSYADEAE